MSAQAAHTVVLCEDTQHETFVRRFLKGKGWATRQIRTERAPAGRGSAEQWVRERLPIELRAYRQRSTHARTYLIVVLDADTGTVAGHVDELEQACRQDGLDPRGADERVLFVIPRRNIETWLAYLRGEPVDEDTTYPRYESEGDCRRDVRVLQEICDGQRQWPQPAPPRSLLTACDEYNRLDA
jgi:hypothetical protein